MTNTHSFHIPVMGIGFTIDTPLKVAQYGMDSVISLVDDILIEKVRKVHCGKFNLPYTEITEKIEDFRAKRITSYLNLINNLAEKKLEEFKNITSEKKDELKEYFNMLPDSSTIKEEFNKLTEHSFNLTDVKSWMKDKLSLGSIDVNIMTKVDKENYSNGEKLPNEFNDAHAALRGYANSNLASSIVLSAGMNPRLYSYIENFNDFFPRLDGYIKKKIILKVSDYRSALIQGKFLAKKGIWVSEFRIESGLNCGGHAFASDGTLMGPILAEFRDKREELTKEIYDILINALKSKDKIIPKERLSIRVSAQGGVGTSEEHDFLMEYYKIDSVGWGTPFLLVPEVTNVDEPTIQQMIRAKEDDLFLSDISPLGVPFNSLRGNTKDVERLKWIAEGIPGSPCPKKYVALDKEFEEKGLCTASRKYQYLKIKQLKEENLSAEEYTKRYNNIVIKSCTCVGLGTSVLLNHNIETKSEGTGVSACPGPNMAYFSKKASLKEMVDHIYGRINLIERTDRPNMFINEETIYIDYLKNKIKDTKEAITTKQKRYLSSFIKNMKVSNLYYQSMFKEVKNKFIDTKSKIIDDLERSNIILNNLNSEIDNL
ncbi:MAG: hypothetical protein WBG43_01345 [Marinifilaceae bacterium]